jgi:serine/threonine protein kinase/Flp pilus assembly protein TadD
MFDRTIAKNPTDLDSILDAFERDDEVSGADVVDYLPDAGNPAYHQIAVELIRVDLERSWARGSKKRLESYRDVMPLLFADPQRLAEIAFEEYRLRRQSGEQVAAAEYKRRYAIDTSVWPRDDDRAAEPDDSRSLLPTRSLVRTRDIPKFPRVGDSFAGFQLVEQLGRGAFGVVFRATQSNLAARDVVLKITATRSVEPQRLARLQHTNVVPLYSMHEDIGLLAICMPFFGRKTLADFNRKGIAPAEQAGVSTVFDKENETLPFGQKAQTSGEQRTDEKVPYAEECASMDIGPAVELVAQLAEALAHAHDRGIVHSDLKPANVLVTDDGVPMLLDFNLSTDSALRYRKATLLVGGTLPYMAPEHLVATLNGDPVIAASDVFSLGVIAFELLTGRRPYPDNPGDFDRTVDLLVSDRSRPVRSARSLNPRVSPGLSAIVAHCLEPKLTSRYTSSAELAEDLRRYQQDLPLRFAADRSIRERGGKWLRRNARGIRWAAAASLVSLVVALSAMYMMRQNRLSKLEASEAFVQFQDDAQTALLNLHAPGTEPELHTIGQAAAKRAIERLDLLHANVDGQNSISRLTPTQRSAAQRQGVELLFALAEPSVNGVPRGPELNRAILYNTAALNLLPRDESAKFLLEQRTKLFTAVGDTSAVAEVRDQLKHAPADEHDMLMTAQSLLINGRYTDAIRAWEKFCKENRQDPLGWLQLGNAYVGAGRLASAEACYTALIALQPKAMNGYLYRGLCRADEGNFAAAEEDYTAALLLNPSVAVSHINRAIAYYSLQNFVAAENDATAAIEGGIADPRAYFVRALIRDAMDKAEFAKADRERGFSMQPVDDKGWVARGISVLRTDPQRAAREFERGVEQYPHSKALLDNLIHVYGDRLEQAAVAIDYANRLVDLHPDDAAALASRAVLYARKGDAKNALRDAGKAATLRPTALSSLQIACVYSIIARASPDAAAQAIEHLRRALAADPKLARRSNDPDLAGLHDNADFKSLVAAAVRLTESGSGGSPASPKPARMNRANSTDKDSTKQAARNST